MPTCSTCQHVWDEPYRFCPACGGVLEVVAVPQGEPSASPASPPPVSPPPLPAVSPRPTPDAASIVSPSVEKVGVGGDVGFVRVHDQSTQTIQIKNLIAPSALASLSSLTSFGESLGDPEPMANLDQFTVPPERLRQVNDRFVQPAGFEVARTTLATHHLLVLVGPAHGGRDMASLALAAAVSRDQPAPLPICLLPPEVPLLGRGALLGQHLGHTVVITRIGAASRAQALPAWLGADPQSALERLEAALQHAQSYAILIWEPGQSGPHAHVLDEAYAARITMPALPDVFERHMRAVLGRDGFDRLRDGLGPDLDSLPNRLRTPRQIEKFARIHARPLLERVGLVPAPEAWASVLQALAQMSDLRVEARELFRSLGSDRQRYLAVTLCLFNGARLTDFWRLQRLLLDASGFSAEEDRVAQARLAQGHAAAPLEPPRHFDASDIETLEAIRAQVVASETDSDLGPVAVKRVRFVDDDLPRALRAYLREHHQARLVALTPVLEQLVTQGNRELRIAAARALGSIGGLDFEGLLRPLVEGWRQADEDWRRAAVGYALDQAIDDEAGGLEAILLLRQWATTRASGGQRWKYQWTAAAALKVIGLERIDMALPEISRLAHALHLWDDADAGSRVFPALTYTLIALSLRGHLLRVHATLGDWLEAPARPEHSLGLTAALAWVQLMAVYAALAEAERAALREQAAHGIAPPAETEPHHQIVRLLMSDTTGALHAQVAAAAAAAYLNLYTMTLDDVPQRDLVLGILETWVEDAAPVAEARQAVADVLRRCHARLGAHDNRNIQARFAAGLRRWQAGRRAAGVASLAREVLAAP